MACLNMIIDISFQPNNWVYNTSAVRVLLIRDQLSYENLQLCESYAIATANPTHYPIHWHNYRQYSVQSIMQNFNIAQH